MTNLERYSIVLTTVYKMLERRGQLTPDLRDRYTEALTTAHALDIMKTKLDTEISNFIALAQATEETEE